MSQTTFRTAYDCLTLRQSPLALQCRNVGKMAVPSSQNDHPRFRDATGFVLPVADMGRAESQGFGEIAQPSFMGDGFGQDVHTHNFNTVVRKDETRTNCQNQGMNKISDRLKEARSQRGWNQAQLAVAAGVSPGTIGNIESGARQAKGSLPQIAKALGVNHDWLANGEGSMKDGPVPDAKVEPSGPSTQAALLAMLFDRLDTDLVLRAQVFNKTSQIIIDTIQGTDESQTQTPAAPATPRKQSV